jgi:hypothetical protein
MGGDDAASRRRSTRPTRCSPRARSPTPPGLAAILGEEKENLRAIAGSPAAISR